MEHVIVLGATSAIAQATIHLFANDGLKLTLVARNEEKLKAVANDAKARGAKEVKSFCTDLAEYKNHKQITDLVENDGIDTVYVAYGVLPDQKACEENFELAEKAIRTNFLSVVSLLNPIANHFAEKNNGTIAVITSVAGDRGRKSIYVYGSA